MRYKVQQQQHKSNHWHYHTAVYTQVTQLHAYHQSSEASITLSGFGSSWICRRISGHIRSRPHFENLIQYIKDCIL